MKERENILFFLCGWIFLLAFLCKKYCSVEMWKQVMAIDPICGEIEGSFAWSLRMILLWKHISLVLHYVMTDMQSCWHDLIELPSLSSWYLEWRSAERVPKLHFPFPYANIRVNLNRFGVTFGVAVPWGCTLLQFENQSLGLKKKQKLKFPSVRDLCLNLQPAQ